MDCAKIRVFFVRDWSRVTLRTNLAMGPDSEERHVLPEITVSWTGI